MSSFKEMAIVVNFVLVPRTCTAKGPRVGAGYVYAAHHTPVAIEFDLSCFFMKKYQLKKYKGQQTQNDPNKPNIHRNII